MPSLKVALMTNEFSDWRIFARYLIQSKSANVPWKPINFPISVQ